MLRCRRIAYSQHVAYAQLYIRSVRCINAELRVPFRRLVADMRPPVGQGPSDPTVHGGHFTSVRLSVFSATNENRLPVRVVCVHMAISYNVIVGYV